MFRFHVFVELRGKTFLYKQQLLFQHRIASNWRLNLCSFKVNASPISPQTPHHYFPICFLRVKLLPVLIGSPPLNNPFIVWDFLHFTNCTCIRTTSDSGCKHGWGGFYSEYLIMFFSVYKWKYVTYWTNHVSFDLLTRWRWKLAGVTD